jgi:predicted AlkP superfamily phosphohydrolase/phosphomutase
MAGTRYRLNVNVVLERAGLLALDPERKIDLSRTRALLLPLADASVAVNTTDRREGIVPLEQKQAVLTEVRKALEQVVDPETGRPVVEAFFAPSLEGLLQPGGATTGDLFLDLSPGYYFSSSTRVDEVITVTRPEGNHIFLPTRRDMLAICGARGPRVPGGGRWPRVRAIDITPTILDILGLTLPRDLPGRSLLPPTPLIESAGGKL